MFIKTENGMFINEDEISCIYVGESCDHEWRVIAKKKFEPSAIRHTVVLGTYMSRQQAEEVMEKLIPHIALPQITLVTEKELVAEKETAKESVTEAAKKAVNTHSTCTTGKSESVSSTQPRSEITWTMDEKEAEKSKTQEEQKKASAENNSADQKKSQDIVDIFGQLEKAFGEHYRKTIENIQNFTDGFLKECACNGKESWVYFFNQGHPVYNPFCDEKGERLSADDSCEKYGLNNFIKFCKEMQNVMKDYSE